MQLIHFHCCAYVHQHNDNGDRKFQSTSKALCLFDEMDTRQTFWLSELAIEKLLGLSRAEQQKHETTYAQESSEQVAGQS